MTARFGIDIGGTFTDFIYQDERSGELILRKVPTTPQDPAIGCMNAITSALAPEQIRAARYFLHGSTVGLNALLERKGSRIGLLTTAGFRDVLEIRRGDNPECSNIWWQPPVPLVPRHLRYEIVERMHADGTVSTPLDLAAVRAVIPQLRAERLEGVAVVLLNAYLNPAHELAVERCLREAGYTGEITLSHRISREAGEYERASTTVVDSVVRGKLRAYLTALLARLTQAGFTGKAFVTRSGGGSLTIPDAIARSFETINSGPAGGAAGAALLARQLALGSVVTADVGGTSFDTTIVIGGEARLLYQAAVLGHPLQTSWLDVRSIGAGGGSIAYVDAQGMLKVGPESAGAVPGPASYARGGTAATVTDAALLLGMLGSGQFQSGLVLDRAQAHAALSPVAARLGLGVLEAARGIIAITAAAMSNTIREITLEQGEDPREMTLLAFGGGGPLLACLLAEDLGISRIVVPNHAGNFSAWGLLGADIVRTAAASIGKPLSDPAMDTAARVAQGLFDELRGGSDSVEAEGTVVSEVILDLRYAGQAQSVPVALTLRGEAVDDSVPAIAARFAAQHRKLYGVVLEETIEIAAARVTRRTALPARAVAYRGAQASAARSVYLPAYSFHLERETDFRLLNRAELSTGAVVRGPAIIQELTTTTYVDANYIIEVHPSGHLFLSRSET